MGLQSFPISEMDTTDDMHEAMFAKRGCCFFLPSCLGSPQPSSHGGSVWWQRIRTVDKLEPDDRWWISGWNKMREWSEILAGPKWKTFIRRVGRSQCCGGGSGDGGGNRPDQVGFRYDSWSYSLNFDDGEQTGRFDDEFPYRDYSMRFTSPSLPVSTKCSIDFDNENYAPPQLIK
ncbi:NHL domain-containing protein [Raphanus sativus]|uniref:Uncharacterized protein LOC108842417 n=1 Tax=Raphanus sativus TaxID=3726 RepID=A0A6J0MFX3_RAPSA|nr:uncharacterized protein LOC108842417 [Raphanus sativus]KAJ4912060.1 NHL domain-containing protein [Raphanus sativus]